MADILGTFCLSVLTCWHSSTGLLCFNDDCKGLFHFSSLLRLQPPPRQIKPWSELSWLVKLYFCLSVASLLVLVGLTSSSIHKQHMGTDVSDEDNFTVSLVQLVGLRECQKEAPGCSGGHSSPPTVQQPLVKKSRSFFFFFSDVIMWHTCCGSTVHFLLNDLPASFCESRKCLVFRTQCVTVC